MARDYLSPTHKIHTSFDTLTVGYLGRAAIQKIEVDAGSSASRDSEVGQSDRAKVRYGEPRVMTCSLPFSDCQIGVLPMAKARHLLTPKNEISPTRLTALQPSAGCRRGGGGYPSRRASGVHTAALTPQHNPNTEIRHV